MEKKITTLLKSHGFTKDNRPACSSMKRIACASTVVCVSYDEEGYDIEIGNELLIVSTDLDQLLNFIESVWPK